MAVEIDGKTYRNLPEQVEENANNIQAILDTIASMGNIMRYKGSVATYADLPTEDNEIGDVYNVVDTGNNYAWDGEAWDEIGSSIDLSGYPEKAQDETITGQWTFQNTLKTTLSTSYPTWNFTGYGASGLDIIYSDNSKGLKLTATLLRPQNDNDMSLGNSSYRYKDLYLSGKTYFSGDTSIYQSNKNVFFQLGNADAYAMYGSAFVGVGGNKNLGTASNSWVDIYLTGAIIAKNTSTTITWGFSSNQYQNMQFERNSVGMFSMSSSAFFPNSNNARDLGTNSLRFRDAYINRNISDGTNSVTVEDLANLIAYAKAQGWIS